MKVLKFGGSSVANTERIIKVEKILKSFEDQKITVVFSAFGGLTDVLIDAAELAAKGDDTYSSRASEFSNQNLEIAKELLNKENLKNALPLLNENHSYLKDLLNGVFLVKELTNRTLDYIMSFGERNSAFIIAQYLNQKGIKANYIDARKLVKTNSDFGKAKVDFKKTNKNIKKAFDSIKGIGIVTGFIGSNKDDVTTTLGRSGSDYTAAIFAAALGAKEIQIWTDVNGVMTADPRKVKTAFSLDKLSYNEAMEMSHFGAKVIHPPTIQPAFDKNIPIRIKNTFEPSHPGSLIKKSVKVGNNYVRGISSIDDIRLFTLQGRGLRGVTGIAGRLFGSLARHDVNIVLITQGSSEYSISFAVNPQDAERAQVIIHEEFDLELKLKLIDPIKSEKELSIVAVVGENMKNKPGISGKLFSTLGSNGINVVAIAQGSSELNISIVIEKADVRKALNVLHQSFFESDIKTIHLFAAGTGLIGSTMFKQFAKELNNIAKNLSLNIKLIGLLNSRKMILDEDGLNFNGCIDNLMTNGIKSDMKSYVEQMTNLNLPNSIFVDNTASSLVSDFYQKILEESISISTANKIAASSSYKNYKKLIDTARINNVQFQNETNVGAGLPVLTTIKDLVSSGDKILKIQGVLSGSLSYIFNNFTPEINFSEIVKEAKEKGYTEPDPREDLSGSDVKRKLLILGRVSGYPFENKDIKINDFLPKKCMEAKSVDAFFDELDAQNKKMKELISNVSKSGNKIRFVGTLENGKGTIGLEEINAEHPFYGLSGSDNMIVITTERYLSNPIVIKGPGAGPEVTSAGVFAEIIRIGKTLN